MNLARNPTHRSGKKESATRISGYSSAMTFSGQPKNSKQTKTFGSESCDDDEGSLIQRKRDDNVDSVVSHQRDELTDSLRALPDKISCMEEQWRHMLREVQRFTTHSDACMRELRLEFRNVKKLALRDNNSVRDMAAEAKLPTDVQAVDLEAMQKKLCLHGEQLKKMEDQIQANDLKHQTTFEKLLDSLNVMNVTQGRILARVDQDSVSKEFVKGSQSPVVPTGHESSATCVQDKPTRVERRSTAFVRGPRSHSPSPLRITPVELDSHNLKRGPQD